MHILRQNFHRQRPWEENIGTGIVDCGLWIADFNPKSTIRNPQFPYSQPTIKLLQNTG